MKIYCDTCKGFGNIIIEGDHNVISKVCVDCSGRGYKINRELERKEKIADAVVKLIEEEIVEYDGDYSMYKYYSERIRTVDDLLKWAEENK